VNSVRAPHHELFYNFVDLNEFSPETVSSSEIARLRNDLKLDGAPVVLFAGRMIEQKGPHLALRALRWARRHGFAAKLLCVGASWYSRNNPTAWIEYLRREAEELNDDVVFTGYIDHSTMPAIYALADIAVAPSIWDDPSPFVVYEAQAMRRPIVGSMRGGIPEIIDDRTTGRCIDVFNTPLFGQIIASLLSDEGERSRLGANGRLRVAERFSLDGAVDQMDQIYQRLLSRHSVA
jgi:spore coat protein SA